MGDLAFPKKPRKPKPKKKRIPKLTVTKVQAEFNAAIRRRDIYCVTSGSQDSLQASHFFEVGGSSALRYHPDNVHSQSAGEHLTFHNRNVMPYTRWMEANTDLEWLERARTRSIKYSQSVLYDIMAMCKADKLDDLRIYIEGLIGGLNG